jgi:hypothetical protein
VQRIQVGRDATKGNRKFIEAEMVAIVVLKLIVQKCIQSASVSNELRRLMPPLRPT